MKVLFCTLVNKYRSMTNKGVIEFDAIFGNLLVLYLWLYLSSTIQIQ